MDILKNSELLQLKGQTAIVTGGAVGIGYGISYRLAEAGANVVVADINETTAHETADKLTSLGYNAYAVVTNVADEESVRHLIQETIKKYDGVNILVNNAGIYPNIPVMKLSAQDFERIIKVNLEGTFLCTKYAAERMIYQNKGGKIINITSIDALHPSMVGLAAYDASKHGMWGFTKNVALELAPHKIWVNAIAPGGITTPGVQTLQQGVDMSKVLDAFLANIPMHRFGEPDDIGKAALFLASDMASYMTGTQIVVDGGVLIN